MGVAFDALRAEVGLASLDELLNRPAWHADALCREHPEANFFPERGGPTEAARALCRRCLVREECAGWAMTQETTLAGIWGGLSGRERKQLRRLAA